MIGGGIVLAARRRWRVAIRRSCNVGEAKRDGRDGGDGLFIVADEFREKKRREEDTNTIAAQTARNNTTLAVGWIIGRSASMRDVILLLRKRAAASSAPRIPTGFAATRRSGAPPVRPSQGCVSCCGAPGGRQRSRLGRPPPPPSIFALTTSRTRPRPARAAACGSAPPPPAGTAAAASGGRSGPAGRRTCT